MQRSGPDFRRNLVIDHPTAQWVEGLPMGNGDLGMMLYGGPEQLTLAFSKSDVWDYRVGPGQGLPAQTTFDEMVATAQRGDYDAYNRLFAKWLEAENCSQPSLQPCGQLDLAILPGERVLGFQQKLDLTCAKAHVHCDFTEYRMGEQAFDLGTFVPARAGVIPVTITNVPDKKLFGKLRLWRQHSLDYDSPRAWQAGDTGGIDMSLDGSVDYTLAVRVLGGRGRWETTDSEAVYTIEPEFGPVVLFVTIVSSLEDERPHETALNRLRAVDTDGASNLEAEHARWWEDFWSRSSVSLPDAELERHWRLGLYAFGSSSQPGKQAPGLQGVWNKYNRPAWHTDYHADGNIEIIYWPAYTSNHLDLAEPYYRLFMVEMYDEAKRAARDFFRRRGLYYPMAGGPGGHELTAPWAWPGAGAWIAQHFWWHYLYSRDVEFLRRVYPFLKELSLFYEDMLQKNEHGAYDVYPTFAPEMMDPRGWLMMAWGRNSTIDLAFIRILFTALIEGSEVLVVDADSRIRWKDFRDNLAPYPCKLGCLLDLEGADWEVLGPMPCRIAPIYPAGEIGLGSPPELLEIARRTYHKVAQRFAGGGHCGVWCASAAAHLGDAKEAVRVLHAVIDGRLENGLSSMMQIDAVFGLPSAVNEMLLQSLDGVIRVFPAVPDDWTASFQTLRAVGALLVSGRIEEGGTTWVRIDSERGGPCTVSDPFGTGRAMLRGGDGQAARKTILAADESGHFRFETEAGGSYELTPA